MTKDEVIEGSLWQVTVYAAFQRAKVYTGEATDEDKRGLKKTLKEAVDAVLLEYERPVSENRHIENILAIKVRVDDEWKVVLDQGGIAIGVVQKAFNLHLKLMWCRDKIPEPPHCPIDKVVIGFLPGRNPTAWTRIRDIGEYTQLIGELKVLADEKGKSLAEWELIEYKKSRELLQGPTCVE